MLVIKRHTSICLQLHISTKRCRFPTAGPFWQLIRGLRQKWHWLQVKKQPPQKTSFQPQILRHFDYASNSANFQKAQFGKWNISNSSCPTTVTNQQFVLTDGWSHQCEGQCCAFQPHQFLKVLFCFISPDAWTWKLGSCLHQDSQQRLWRCINYCKPLPG